MPASPCSSVVRRALETGYEAKLQGIDPQSSYEVSFAETYDVGSKRVITGSELAHLRVKINHAPGSLLVRYRKN